MADPSSLVSVLPLSDPELFVGLVGPLGVDLTRACEMLAGELAVVGYRTHPIRVSLLLKSLTTFGSLTLADERAEDERIAAYMDAGDKFRHAAKSGAALVHLAINKVRSLRQDHGLSATEPLSRTAYVFNSLKHPDEVKELRRVYGSQFICISFYEPRSARIGNLEARIEQSRKGVCRDARQLAERLIDRDAQAIDPDFGQKVSDAFPLADLFARSNVETGAMLDDIRRAVGVIFGDPFCTPTPDEYCMFLARAAALRSADLSRQVGAVVANDRGDVIASGCNEVPRPGGGNYWTGDEPDRRDFRRGKDLNVAKRRDLIEEVFAAMKGRAWLGESYQGLEPSELARKAIDGGIFDGLLVDNLIEYSRVVHAEMNALMDAVRRGVAVANQSLYCTTFPCHLCARHIMAAGIQRVVFVEPYPKSLVKDLYGQAVSIENEAADHSAVKFDPFVGVAPRTYMAFFGREKRKDTAGYVMKWDASTAQPQLKAYFVSYLDIEKTLCDSLLASGKLLGLEQPSSEPGASS